jgi:hypothetical protein
MAKTKNGLVTLVVPEGDVGAIFNALDTKAQDMEVSTSDTQKRKAVELRHTRSQLYEQASAQGWRSM